MKPTKEILIALICAVAWIATVAMLGEKALVLIIPMMLALLVFV